MRDRTEAYKYKSVGELLASNLLEYLSQGGTGEGDIRKLATEDLDYIHEKNDCADFRAAYCVRILYSFEELLPEDVRKRMVEELLIFPYEDCGGHGMCTWTENHRLYSAGSEYLMAQKYADSIFGDGRGAEYHLKHAEEYLSGWISKAEKYGLCEWESNNYYSETLAGLANIIQFVNDKKISEGAGRVFTNVLFDIFSQTAYNDGYMFNPACSRAYVDNKISSAYGNYEEIVISAMKGSTIRQYKEKEACVILMLQAKDEKGNHVYRIPEKLMKLLEKEEKETAICQGVNISDYGKEGLSSYSKENVIYAFEGGAISDYRVINNSMRYLTETGLIHNSMLSVLKPLSNPLLVKSGILKFVKKLKDVPYDGAAMEEGRVYTYVNRNYSVSAAFDYRVGEISYQQNSLAVNLSHKISLFANSPCYEKQKSGSPGYWIGSATTPRAAADKNVGVVIFDVAHAKIGLKKTHLFFPTGCFDETDISRLDEGILFGTSCGVNVCVRTNPGVTFIPAEESLREDKSLYQDEKIPKGCYDKEYDLINNSKGFHYYLFEVDNTKSFEDFKREMNQKELEFDDRSSKLAYGRESFVLSYKGPFMVNGVERIPDFKRPAELLQDYMNQRQ